MDESETDSQSHSSHTEDEAPQRHRMSMPATSGTNSYAAVAASSHSGRAPGPRAPSVARASSRGTARQHPYRAARPSITRQEEIVVISSSDEEDDRTPSQSLNSQVRRETRRQESAARAQSATAAGDPHRMDYEAATSHTRASASREATVIDQPSEFLVERVVRTQRPEAIEILDDSILEETAPNSAQHVEQADETSEQRRNLPAVHRSPQTGRAPVVAHPLLSKYNCPICLCVPFPHAVITPCGHLFCSECLFEALVTPIRQERQTLREQQAAFAALRYNQAGAGLFGGFAMPAQHFAHSADDDWQSNLPGLNAQNGNSQRSSGQGQSSNQPVHHQQQPRPARSANHGEVDPLVGPCPVCRAQIPGGFIAHAGLPATKKRVLGLQIKLGKPIDDPRREEPTAVNKQ